MRPGSALALALALVLAGCTAQEPPPPDMTSQPSPETVPEPPSQPPADPAPAPETNQTEQANETVEEEPSNETSRPPGPKPKWGHPERAPIYPGVYLHTEDTSCTANFLFTSPDYRHIYIGTAAHCVAESTSEACDPSTPEPIAPGSPVRFLEDGQGVPDWWTGQEVKYLPFNGTLVYNSYYTIRQLADFESSGCRNNDFALVEIPLKQQGEVTPYFRTGDLATSVLAPEDIHVGDEVLAYGHSHYWMGAEELYAKHGIVTRPPPSSWQHWTFTAIYVPHGIFGDSGSPVVRLDGGAVGLITLLASGPITNDLEPGIGNAGVTLWKALEYMHEHTDLRVQLAEP